VTRDGLGHLAAERVADAKEQHFFSLVCWVTSYQLRLSRATNRSARFSRRIFPASSLEGGIFLAASIVRKRIVQQYLVRLGRLRRTGANFRVWATVGAVAEGRLSCHLQKIFVHGCIVGQFGMKRCDQHFPSRTSTGRPRSLANT